MLNEGVYGQVVLMQVVVWPQLASVVSNTLIDANQYWFMQRRVGRMIAFSLDQKILAPHGSNIFSLFKFKS